MHKFKYLINKFLDNFIKNIHKKTNNLFLKLLLKMQKNQKTASIDYYKNSYENLVKNYSNELDFEKDYQYKIEKNFILPLAKHTQVVFKKSPLNIDHGRLLYSILADYITARKLTDISIFETGTARGFSSICMAKALSDLNQNGKIYTFDIIPHNLPIYWNVIDDHFGKNSRKNLLSAWKNLIDNRIIFIEGPAHINLEKINLSRINFAFLDGSHFGHDIRTEIFYISSFQKDGDIIVFDDYDEIKYPDLVYMINNLLIKCNYSKKIIKSLSSRHFLIATKLS